VHADTEVSIRDATLISVSDKKSQIFTKDTIDGSLTPLVTEKNSEIRQTKFSRQVRKSRKTIFKNQQLSINANMYQEKKERRKYSKRTDDFHRKRQKPDSHVVTLRGQCADSTLQSSHPLFKPEAEVLEPDTACAKVAYIDTHNGEASSRGTLENRETEEEEGNAEEVDAQHKTKIHAQ